MFFFFLSQANETDEGPLYIFLGYSCLGSVFVSSNLSLVCRCWDMCGVMLLSTVSNVLSQQNPYNHGFVSVMRSALCAVWVLHRTTCLPTVMCPLCVCRWFSCTVLVCVTVPQLNDNLKIFLKNNLCLQGFNVDLRKLH